METPQVLINEKAAGQLLCVPATTLRRWRWMGRGPRFVRVGRCVRYSLDELQQFIERNTRRSTSDGAPR